MLACAVHVTARGEQGWALGCNFTRSLSEEDLQALLWQPPPHTSGVREQPWTRNWRDEEVMSFRNVPLAGEPPQTPDSNRRAAIRYHCAPATAGRVLLPPRQEMQRGWVLDVSLGGVGLLLGRPLTPGTSVVIRMSGPEDGQAHELPAQVIHATREIGGEWVVGCQLTTPLTRDELDALLWPLAPRARSLKLRSTFV
jgi:hypothetical protein